MCKMRGKGEKLSPTQPRFTKFQLQKAFMVALSIPKRPRKKWQPIKKWKSGVRKAALRGYCTEKIEVLAQPHPRKVWGPNKDVIRPVRRAALKCKTPEWNLANGLPKMMHVTSTLKDYFERLGNRQREAVRRTLQKVVDQYHAQFPPQGENNVKVVRGIICHKKCVQTKVKRVLHRRYICQLNKKERKGFLLRMIRMGMPVTKPKPPKPERGPKKSVEKMNLKRLARPRPVLTLSPRDPWKVPEAALTAKPSPWIEKLARHREPRPPPTFTDFKGNEILPPRKWDLESRKKVVASERTAELAIPKTVKKKLADDVKADPFMVSRAALNAVCSERLAELAMPIVRD